MIARSSPFWVSGQPPTQKTVDWIFSRGSCSQCRAQGRDAFGLLVPPSKQPVFRWGFSDATTAETEASEAVHELEPMDPIDVVPMLCKMMMLIMFLSFAVPKQQVVKVQMKTTWRISFPQRQWRKPRIEKAEPAPCNRWSKRRFQNASEGAV